MVAADVLQWDDEDDVGVNSVSATSSVQEIGNCGHDLPPADSRQSSSNSRLHFRPTLRQVEPDAFHGFCDNLFTRGEGQNGHCLERMDVSESTAADVQRLNNVNDSDVTEARNKPLPINHANHVTDSLPSNDKKFVTEKRAARCKLFEGIGPTDEDTGVPIASRTVSKIWFSVAFTSDFYQVTFL